MKGTQNSGFYARFLDKPPERIHLRNYIASERWAFLLKYASWYCFTSVM